MSFLDVPLCDVYVPSPCRHCTAETGRYPGCHDKCDRYIEFKQALEDKKEAARQAKFLRSGLYTAFNGKYRKGPKKSSEV